MSRYSEDKGFGFICRENGQEIRVQRSDLDMTGYRFLNLGEHVRFEVEKTVRGLEARKVQKLS